MIKRAWLGILLGLAAVSGGASAQRLPFAPGEELRFTVKSSKLGGNGSAVMKVTADTLRGQDVYLLSFDFKMKILLFSASDQTRSWLDPVSFSSMKYTKRERSPVGKKDESVEIFAAGGYWRSGGDRFASSATEPLDELSFLYLLRVLPLEAGTLSLNRHFDPARNPVTVRVLRREALALSLDGDDRSSYQTVVVEMRVRDARQKSGSSVLLLHLTDDEHKVPVRIESSMPVGGTMIMSLQSRVVR